MMGQASNERLLLRGPLGTSAYDGSQAEWRDSFPVRNTETGLTLRAKVDATLTQVTLYLLKPQLRKLLLAVWADR